MDHLNAGFLKNRVALLSNLSEERLRALADGSQIVSLSPGEIVIHAGDEMHFLGVVLEGKIAASVPAGNGAQHSLGELGPGETFGEMALLSGDPALADLRAAEPSRVMLVPLTLFQSHIMAEPRSLQQVSRTISARFQQVMGDPEKAAAVTRKEDVAGLLELKSERPERVLVLNCGSSSLKYTLFDTERPEPVTREHIERIGPNGYADAFAFMLVRLENASAISVVGHRVVHGGEKFTNAVLIDDAILAEIEALSPLAPLHNPVNIAGIREARRAFPAIPHVAVFDTAFHATLAAQAFLYGLPNEFYEKKGVRRYGFHGSSHSYVALAAAQFLKRRPRELRIISCHLGNGASLCAIDHGRSVDTSMGFTPGEGLIMGTRCGDLDAGVLTFLQRVNGMTSAQVDELLNKKSGLLGLSGISGDMREVEKAAEEGDAHALTALKMFCYRVRKYIGSYIAALGGLDVLIFTAGIGQGSAGVRATALQGLICMGIHLDDARNRAACGGREIARISTDDSPVTVLVVPTDEERIRRHRRLTRLHPGRARRPRRDRQRRDLRAAPYPHDTGRCPPLRLEGQMLRPRPGCR